MMGYQNLYERRERYSPESSHVIMYTRSPLLLSVETKLRKYLGNSSML